MKKITLTLDDETLEASRAYAARHHTTLDALVDSRLEKVTAADRRLAVAEMFRLMDAYPGDSRGARWNRGELHGR